MDRRAFLLAGSAALGCASAARAVPRHGVAVGAAPLPPSGGDYPDQVVAAANLRGDDHFYQVWDLKTAAGSRVAQADMTAVAALGLPAAKTNPVVYRTATTNPAQQIEPNASFMVLSGPQSYSQVDFTGAGIYVYNDGAALTLTDCHLHNPGGHILQLGYSDGASAVTGVNSATLSYVTLDYTLAENADAIVSGNNPANLTDVFTYDHCAFLHGSRGFWQSNCAVTMTWCYEGGFDQHPKNNDGIDPEPIGDRDHSEADKFNGGALLKQNCLQDATADPLGDPGVSDYTALWFVTSGIPSSNGSPLFTATSGVLAYIGQPAQDIDATYDGCIIYGAKEIHDASIAAGGEGLLYPLQAKASLGKDTRLTIKNTLIEKGGTGYITIAMQGYMALTSASAAFKTTGGVAGFGEVVTGRTSGAKAQVLGYNATSGLLTIAPITQATSNRGAWEGLFQPGETIDGNLSGASAVIGDPANLQTCVLQNSVTITDGGGNIDWASGKALNVVTGLTSG